MWTKEQILQNAMASLNKEDQPWQVTVEGDSIIATWKWMNAVFFAPTEVTDEVKEYKFIVTLLDNGKWKEKDIINESSAGFSKGGFGFNKSSFYGHTYSKSVTIGFGKDKDTGEVGIVKSKFDTSMVKEPIRAFLKGCGWKKKGFF